MRLEYSNNLISFLKFKLFNRLLRLSMYLIYFGFQFRVASVFFSLFGCARNKMVAIFIFKYDRV